MKQKVGQQPDVLETIHRRLSLSEEKRRKQRFDYNLAALAQGSIQVLANDEFVTDLVLFFETNPGERDHYRKLIGTLGEAVSCPERTIRERALAVLSVAGLNALHEQNGEKAVLIIHSFYNWLEFESELLPGLTVVFKQIKDLSGWLLRMSSWQEAEKIVTLLAGIHSGRLTKHSAIRSLAGKTLDNLATESIIDKIVDGCLQKDIERDHCRELLQGLGRGRAGGLLLKRFLRSGGQLERVALLDLLAKCAGETLPVLVGECLRQEPSADHLKDLIRFVADGGRKEVYPALQPCLDHEDKQVQHEMVRCVVKIGGRGMRNSLLAGLEKVHESLKIAIIRLLAEHAGGDGAVLSALCDFVEQRDAFPQSARQKLIRAVVIALRAFPHPRTIDVLGSLYREYENLPGSDRLLLQIDRSLNTLTPQLRHNRQHDDDEDVTFDSDPQHRQMACGKVAKIEQEVRKILRRGDSAGAGRLLCQYARAAGRERDFVTAEMLKDRILQIDPMALIEAVELGRWLEDQKNVAAEPLSGEAWKPLGELLSPIELQALQKALRRENYRKGETIIQAGEADEALFFLTDGHIGVDCFSGGNQRFVKRMNPGAVLGRSQFFAASVWTCSLRALSPLQVYLLDRAAFGRIAGKFSEFEQKLYRYCAKYEERIAELLKTTGDDRREFPRYQANMLITNSLQDPYGVRESRTFNGELIDISRTGLAFTVKIAGRENARLLLGREIVSVIQAEGEPIARCSGIVVGVRHQDAVADSFSIHVKLAGKIDDLPFNRIVASSEYYEDDMA